MEYPHNPEIREIEPQPTELHTEEELFELWSTYRRNNGITFPDPVKEEKAVRLQVKDTLKQLSKSKDPVHFYGLRENGRMVATGRVSFYQDNQNNKHGYLSLLTVDPEYRGRDIAGKMTETRVTKALTEGCTYIDTEVYADNAPALVTKFNDDFEVVAGRYDGDELYGFLLSKKIDTAAEVDQTGKAGIFAEAPLDDKEKLKELLESGWVGVDLKNLGDKDDKDPAKWVMIFEK